MTSMDKQCSGNRVMCVGEPFMGNCSLAARTWLKWLSTRVYTFLRRDLFCVGLFWGSGLTKKACSTLGGTQPTTTCKSNMYISFWLNRYHTNKNNAARKWRNIKNSLIWFITFWKPSHLFFIPFSNWIIHSALQERQKRKKIVPSHGTWNKSFRRNQKNWMFLWKL